MTLTPIYSVFGVTQIPEVQPGDDLSGLIHDALLAQETPLERGDVLLVTQKIVSKAEGRLVALATVEPSDRAREWAAQWDRDPACGGGRAAGIAQHRADGARSDHLGDAARVDLR